MKLARLLDMSLGEVAGRLRQEASKWRERSSPEASPFGEALAPEVVAPAWRRLVAGSPAGGFAADPGEPAPGSFFEGVEQDAIAELVRKFPASCEAIVAAADEIARGRIDLLGRTALRVDPPVDWQLDPVRRVRFPFVHWSRIDVADPAGGEVKLVWELNRHQWLVRLAQAYRLTGDERYASLALEHVEHWMRTNPYGIGINWASSLEVALRAIAWCWTLALLRGATSLSVERLARILACLASHAAHVERYLSRWSSPNTHLTGEALGLFYVGAMLPEVVEAERWRRLGRDVLVEQLERQVLADGVYFEQSTWYQRYTADIYHHFLVLAARNGVWVPWSIGERLTRLVDFLVSVRRPDGSVPQIGDGDGGTLLPLEPRTPADFGGTFTAAAMLFGRGDYAWAAGAPGPEALWIGGTEGWEHVERLRRHPPRRSPSAVYRAGGYAILRSGWEREDHQLVLDFGPLGCRHSAGHGHDDMLAVECSAFGEPFVVDPGTFLYGHAGWRDHFRGSEAHSTLSIDGRNQAVPAGTFSWASRPPTPVLRTFSSDEGEDHVDVERRAGNGERPTVVHRRRILFVKPRFWLIVDDVTGAGQHEISLRFQLAPVEIERVAGGFVRARGRRASLLLRSFAPAALDMRIVSGWLRPRLGWYSPEYGRRVPAPLVELSGRTRLPLTVATLLVPCESVDAPPPTVVATRRRDGSLEALRLVDTDETIAIDEDVLRVARDDEAG
jgi:hypothetical protein